MRSPRFVATCWRRAAAGSAGHSRMRRLASATGSQARALDQYSDREGGGDRQRRTGPAPPANHELMTGGPLPDSRGTDRQGATRASRRSPSPKQAAVLTLAPFRAGGRCARRRSREARTAILAAMEERIEPCPDCATPVGAEDNYCRQCGMFLAALRPGTAVTRTQSRAMAPARPGMPAPVKRVATAIAVGAALQVGVGLAGRYLATHAARQAALAATSRPQRPAKGRPATRNADPGGLDEATAVSETLVVRRVWIRRG